MNRFSPIILILLLLIMLNISAQNPEAENLKKSLLIQKEDTSKVNLLNQLTAATIQTPDAIIYGNQAVSLAEKLKYTKGKALALKNLGLYNFYKSDFVPAEEYWRLALKEYTDLKDEVGKSNMLNNLGTINSQIGNSSKAMEYYLLALESALKTTDTVRIATTLNNVGSIYMSKPSTFDLAIDYLNKGLLLATRINDKANMGLSYVNLGEVYFQEGKDSLAFFNFSRATEVFDPSDELLPYTLNSIGKLYNRQGQTELALKYHEEALKKAMNAGSKINIAQSSLFIAYYYELKKQHDKALSYFEKARALATEIRAAPELKQAYLGLSQSYYSKNDYKNAYKFRDQSALLADSLFTFAADSLQLKYTVGLKEKQIDILTKDKDLKDLELKRQKIAKNALMVGLGLVFLIIGILYRDYRLKVKTNYILDHQKAEIESLLLNILPAEVAHELQTEGHATPKYFDHATVLFTDFKGFTRMADALSPQELVAELNDCFMAFDDIIEKYNLEKIKTIGDSYMCAGGIPTPDPTATLKMIEASFDIIEYLKKWNEQRTAIGLKPWELRIGIHVGPLVAGVVGKKKYAYDIWGSTVNIASRMESAGEPGQVNISSSVYDIVKNHYDCQYRGKISAKNIGEIDMYFVTKAKEVPKNMELARAVSES
ncbi:adenylate/guanylate cyclase domain-containing protein [Flavihumibacter fluvii]|uniref:adenylate/guanylate cyclase domain-containing protein n=1 Tax=Flavihumibacter fluvii TaxID=2838157 RepID=UPI001BDF6DBC|nr:adenylate/guanylate cyclase domain-containing protein [Flavihumibacter fluvii]ULQ50671.1 tetratricopeptide repeat protein [Flavihumibacter fluvii]